MFFSTLPPLSEVIERDALLAKKSLGQHFLLDSRVTTRIAQSAGDLSQCHVIEVGPGPGGLTRALLTAGAQRVIAVEKDERCLPALEELRAASEGRLTVICGDALKADWLTLAPAPRKIVANLPYNIGTPLLFQWLDIISAHGRTGFESLTLMFQQEVADRIVAASGRKDYGRLSVMSQWLCECRPLLALPPGAFSPPPKVSSAVVQLTVREKPLFEADKKTLERVVAAAFGQRRKMLRTALKTLGVAVDPILERARVDGSCRAEQLDIEAFCRLARAYTDS